MLVQPYCKTRELVFETSVHGRLWWNQLDETKVVCAVAFSYLDMIISIHLVPYLLEAKALLIQDWTVLLQEHLGSCHFSCQKKGLLSCCCSVL